MNDRIYKTGPRKSLNSTRTSNTPSKIYVPIAPSHLPARERLKWAMDTIILECQEKGGYPYAETVVIQEILRRGALSKQYLEKPRQKKRKADVTKFLEDNHDLFRSRSYKILRETDASPSGTRGESAELRRIRDCMVLLELELDTANKLLARERAVTTQLYAAIDLLRGGSEDKQI